MKKFQRYIPKSRWLRLVVGLLFIIGGLLGFLPVLGFWMIPLGLVILSVDFKRVRRLRRRSEVALGRRAKHVMRRINEKRNSKSDHTQPHK